MISNVKRKTEISLNHQERSNVTPELFVRAIFEGSGSERGNGLRMGPSRMLVGRPASNAVATLRLVSISETSLFSLLFLDLFLSLQGSADHATRHPFAAF
jgi:hypothetical protein